MTKDSASRTCPNGHSYTIEGGVDVGGREWSDEDICPTCGAEPGDKVTPEDATPEVLDEWIADNGQPGCPACETGDAVEWVPMEDRPAPGARWQCDCCGRYIDADGAELEAELAQHQPEERVGECGCGDWAWGVLIEEDTLCPSFGGPGCHDLCPEKVEDDTFKPCGKDGPRPQWYFAASPSWSVEAWGRGPRRCNECDWELDQQTGIARRNADTARVQRVREALGKHRALLCTDAECDRSARTIAAAVRAALDGQDNEEVTV